MAAAQGSPSTDPATSKEYGSNVTYETVVSPSEKAYWNVPFLSRRSTQIDPEAGTHRYRNVFGVEHTQKNDNAERYLSRTRFRPRRLRVQASKHGITDAHPDWKRVDLVGSVPQALRWSEWILKAGFPRVRGRTEIHWSGVPKSLLCIVVFSIPLQLYLSFPFSMLPWNEKEADESYYDWPGYLWTWPQFAVNPLDMSPTSPESAQRVISAKARLLRPRLLVVEEKGEWIIKNLDDDPLAWRPYVMVSYTNAQWHTTPFSSAEMTINEKRDAVAEANVGREQLIAIAKEAAKREGLHAYWLDFQCREPVPGHVLDSDVYRFSDVVRGSSQVVIALKDSSDEAKLQWGQRLWTLPEGLLAPENRVGIYYADVEQWTSMRKVEMAGTFWRGMGKGNAGDWEATRLLAEHFSGTLQLSRLQLMSTAVAALWDRNYTGDMTHKQPELTMALMGLLHTRIDPIQENGKWHENETFRNLAKLSLLNDSDQLVERMVSLLPVTGPLSNGTLPSALRRKSVANEMDNNDGIFSTLRRPDEYETHLWDIHPTCEVVGVAAEPWTIVLNETRAIPIRWKAFPRILYSRSLSWKKLAAEIFLRSGLWWIAFGINLIYTYAPLWAALTASDGISRALVKYMGAAVGLFFAVGLVLSFISPMTLRVLYGGVPVRAAPHLVGFEGYMPITELEEIVFGNDGGRLTYSPSSSPFARNHREAHIRAGKEPDWMATGNVPPLKPGHRLFTLVDTGSMTVSLFQAKRPPTVALIAGREGGMLRAVLCRWKSNGDCLQKETVLRMPTDLYDIATPKGWLKLQLRDD